MNKGKSILAKILLSTMILTMLFTSTTLSASASNLTPTLEDNEVLFKGKLVDAPQGNDDEMTTYATSGNKFWQWVTGVMVVFVGVQVAQTVVSNMINNGIKATCDKWDDNWGVRQGCKIISP